MNVKDLIAFEMGPSTRQGWVQDKAEQEISMVIRHHIFGYILPDI